MGFGFTLVVVGLTLATRPGRAAAEPRATTVDGVLQPARD